MTRDLTDEDPGSDYERLETPPDGIPGVVDTVAGKEALLAALHEGRGPVAVDAERASGYRYGQRAYLIQLRREGAGTWLVDPTVFDGLGDVDEALAGADWVLHAATQDIPCLAEVGMRPRGLFDTELGARLAGLPRVGLSAVLEYYLGVTLAKEHSAVDWSTRPLPEPWLRYAALDVELLVPLRERMERDLREQGKLDWAEQEFAALCHFTGPPGPDDPDAWRRTTGVHRLRKRRALGALRELWLTRDRIAQERDVPAARVLPDGTLIDLAHRMPAQASGLGSDRKESSRTRQRRAEQGLLRHQRAWLAAIKTAAQLPEEELPEPARRGDTPPPPRAWAEREPAAAERLTRVRADLADLSDRLEIPVENLMTPDVVRRVLWRPPEEHDADAVDAATAELGARPWQRELVVPILVEALTAHP
ncbi:HRDC domain-containing protein [Serinicoccus kebangsaanensis]|uniref:HRDC domain-containing protein n=1 Tax=Serinicoccus kebangsaanensis TaxID=2602069 RepID=UPI00124C7AB0|nr:HRDC domain-containing protein [Serinicoccus kebangsaanensis]